MNVNRLSLKGRAIMAISVLLLTCSSLMLISALESFDDTLDKITYEQLATNANTMLAAAAKEAEDGQLDMPETLGVKRLDTPHQNELRGYIYDSTGKLLWQSVSTDGVVLDYEPDFDLENRVAFSLLEQDDKPYLVYEVDTLLGLNSGGYSFVTVVPGEKYQSILTVFQNSLQVWVSMISILILLVCWVIIWWILKPFRTISGQLSEIESGNRDAIEGSFPTEVTRLTDSINKLLYAEQRQRDNYRTTMDDLTHSLKTPLVVMQSFSDTLKLQSEHPDGAAIKAICHDIDKQVSRMNQIVGYHLHKTVAGQHGLKQSKVQVEPIIQDLRKTLAKVYLEKQVTAQVLLDPSCIFHGDKDDLMEIIGNLMENAFKFTYSMIRITGFVEKKTDDTAAQLVITIEDDGPGIAFDERESVFQRGVRADCQKPGQGIGLAIVSDLVEGYKGQIKIDESELGGVLIEVRLP